MLDRTGDTDCEVYMRTNGLTGLADLQILRLPACIYNCTGTAYCTAENSCKIIQKFKVLCRADSTATGYQNFCIHDIYCIRNSLNYFFDIYIFIIGFESRIVFNNLSLSTLYRIDFLHNAGTYGSHLRTVIGTCDGSDSISTECRTSHKKLIVLLLFSRNCNQREITNLKLCTVCCQTGSNSSRNGRTKVTTDCCCTNQHNFRLVLIDYRSKSMSIRLSSVLLQFRIIYYDYTVCTVLCKLIYKVLYIRTNQYCCYLCVQGSGKSLCFTKQFKSNTTQLIVYLLCKDKYAFIFF